MEYLDWWMLSVLGVIMLAATLGWMMVVRGRVRREREAEAANSQVGPRDDSR